MRRAALLFLVGLSPFLLGWLLSRAMMTIFAEMGGAWLYLVLGLAMLMLWAVAAGILGFKGSKGRMALTVLCLNLPAAVVLVLLGVQELALHAYWTNAVGLWTQMFYLPVLRLGAILGGWTGQLFWAYFAAFLLLVLVSWMGCRARQEPGEKT